MRDNLYVMAMGFSFAWSGKQRSERQSFCGKMCIKVAWPGYASYGQRSGGQSVCYGNYVITIMDLKSLAWIQYEQNMQISEGESAYYGKRGLKSLGLSSYRQRSK